MVIIIAGIMLLPLVIPYLRWFIKRIIMVIKIKKICRRKNFCLYKTHMFWFLGRAWGQSCDFYIETPTQILSIKLFETLHHNSIVIFTDNGKYFVRRFIGFVANSGAAIRIPIDGRKRNCQLYDFRRDFRMDWEVKTPKNILLINPICHEIRKIQNHGEDIILGAGEFINGMEIQSLSRLIGYLEANKA